MTITNVETQPIIGTNFKPIFPINGANFAKREKYPVVLNSQPANLPKRPAIHLRGETIRFNNTFKNFNFAPNRAKIKK